MNYEFSQVRVTPVPPMNGLVAFASLVLNGNLRLNSIAIHRKMDGSGYRLTYPTKRAGNEDRTTFHPITPELSKAIERVLFDEYLKLNGS
jgi:DNA-binding cell septation regulator SpoVG